MSRSLTLFALAAAALTGCNNEGLTPVEFGFEDAGEVIEGQFIISMDLSDETASELGLVKIDFDPSLGMGLYEATEDGVSRTVLENALRPRSKGNFFVEGNRPRELMSTNDPYRSLQWNLDILDIDTAWTITQGAGVTVAVLDTGVSSTGEDTPINMVAGYDFVNNDRDASDEQGHGTHVAGTIAQATNNRKGVAGVAPQAAIMPVRVLDRYGSGSSYWIARGITFAVDNGADVINMSLGSAYGSSAERQAIDYAIANNVVVVAATGNDGRNSVSYPAAYDAVIAVGATDARGAVTSYSNGGNGIDVVAPGGNTGRDDNRDGYGDGILQETLSGRGMSYQFFEGTSMATPHVAGIAALLLAEGARPQDIEGILTATADDLNTAGWDNRSGFGQVNPVRALAAVSGNGGDAPDTGNGGGNNGGNNTPPADTTGPEISNVGGYRSGTTLVLTWTTDEPADSYITFDGYGTYGDSSLVTNHELRFTIDSSATYYFDLHSTDAAGNKTTDAGWVTRP